MPFQFKVFSIDELIRSKESKNDKKEGFQLRAFQNFAMSLKSIMSFDVHVGWNCYQCERAKMGGRQYRGANGKHSRGKKAGTDGFVGWEEKYKKKKTVLHKEKKI